MTQKSFLTQQKVRFGDVDPAGIVYYPKVFDLIHEAFEDLWDVHVGKRYYHLIGEERLGFPLVNSQVDFVSPMRFGDRPVVRITCFHVGRSSLGLRYVFEVDDRVCVDARMTVCCIQLDELRAVPIPDAYRARFEALKEEPLDPPS
ncbi:MAG: thioesterase family protein [Planctomycetota bacterium]